MGREVEHTVFSREDRRRFRDKLRRSLDALAEMLRESRFDFERPMTGMEIELNLVDEAGEPANVNARVLELVADPSFQTEMGQFNIEINVAPREIAGRGLASYEQAVRASLNAADERARAGGCGRLVMIGILPTLMPRHVSIEAMSASARFAALNEQIFAARGEDMALSIDGVERLRTYADSITPEAACTSFQLHLQVSPGQFVQYWNAAQAIAGVQLALASNSPYLFGTELWRETRIPLFEQVTDTRPEELKEQGVRPRVWFGERWVTSVFDLFEENARYFPALLPICDDADPMEQLRLGVPTLGELSLHNGTVYRWNRPIYAVVDGRPHLRVENRVLPAGPTVIDAMANAAFYYGLVRALADQERPVWSQMSFSAAEENFHSGARDGLDATVYWPGLGQVPAGELVLRRLLPLAHAGLDSWGVDPSVRDRLLGIIEGRCMTGNNGASWQVGTVRGLQDAGSDRVTALHDMLRRYLPAMHSNEPVHTWPP